MLAIFQVTLTPSRWGGCGGVLVLSCVGVDVGVALRVVFDAMCLC